VARKRATHRFQGLLHLGFAAAATRARHVLVPIPPWQEARVHPLLPSGRQDAWRHILPHPLPPKIPQGRESRSLLADFVPGVVMCRPWMAPRSSFDRLHCGV
jgi:hypothetical protein